MKDLFKLNKYFYKYRWRLIPGVLFVIISNVFGVLPAQVIRVAFDLVNENISIFRLFSGFDRQQLIYTLFGSSVMLFGFLVLLLALMRGLFLFFMRQTIILMSRHIEYDMKNEIYRQYQDLSLAFYRRNNTGDLMNRVTEDVSRVRMYVGPAIMYTINTVVLFVLIIFAMLQVNVKLAVYSLIPLPLLAYTIYKVHNIINVKSEKIQEQLSVLSGFVQENFAGIRVIKAYGRELRMKAKFAGLSEDYKKTSLDLVQVQALFFPSMLLLAGLSTIITIYVGGREVMNGSITSGNIAEFIMYLNQLMFPFMSLGWVTSLVQRAAASQKRINEFLNLKPEIVSANTQPFDLRGNIRFEGVSFIYPETGITAVRNLNLDIKAGEFVAIIGKTGSGKSTVANLLLRMYDVSEGEIVIDGKPLKELNLKSYRRQTGVVPQDVFLFSDTIANNITFGVSHAEETEIEEAARNAAVYTNIMDFEHKFGTMVGERGLTLSGGQKQRISIARALIKKPHLLILDNCLSAVDTKTEEEILSNLGRTMSGRTTLVIAHRISTIKNADKIIVMDNGSVAEFGNHLELMQKRGIYADLFEKQLLEEQDPAR